MNWQYLVFAAAGLVAIAVVAWEIARHWSSIVEALVGPRLSAGDERWRRVHLDADRRRPFQDLRRRRR